MFWRIVGGLLMVAFGALFVLRTQWFMNNIGTIPWAEQKLGGGGSNLLYKLIGLMLAFFGFLITTGLMGGFINATIGKLFNL